MRLHRLSVTAFGPFVDTAEVDFDELSAAGLFLLSGATGAGKSSVLDAVCFALYGAVPGDRQDAGRLRSDQAPLRLAPQVSLEVSLSGRRFRVDRSPAWDRPKKRGTGTTREQARVTLSERVADEWVPPDQPARRGRRPGLGPARDEPRPVLPGGDAAAGTLPGVPPGRSPTSASGSWRGSSVPAGSSGSRPGCATIGSPSAVGPRSRRRSWETWSAACPRWRTRPCPGTAPTWPPPPTTLCPPGSRRSAPTPRAGVRRRRPRRTTRRPLMTRPLPHSPPPASSRPPGRAW